MAEDSWRSSLPEALRLRLRQEAYFGCCRCGFPIYDYHHIAPPSESPYDLMLLCPNCHRMVTQGAVTEAEQRYHKLEPYNLRKGFVKGQLKVDQTVLVLSVGSNQFVGDGRLIVVDDEDLVMIGLSDDGRLELSVRLYDQHDSLIAIVNRNEWQSGTDLPWDLQSGFQWIRIRNRPRDIALEIDARVNPIEVRGDLWWKKQNFKLGSDWTTLNEGSQDIKVGNLCFVGGCFVADSREKALRITPDPRYGRMFIVSETDLQKRIEKGMQELNKLRADQRQNEGV